jgi:hypothetical protein
VIEQVYDSVMSLATLREAIEKLDDPCGTTRAELIDAFALHDRMTAWLTAAVGGFDRDEVYELDNASSSIAWIKFHCRQTGGDASRLVTTARKLRSLPHVANGFRSGELGSGHVRAVVSNVPDRHLEKFAEVEDAMVPALAALPVADATTVMQQWAIAAADADPAPEPQERPDALHISETMDGRRELSGHLSAESAIEIEQALAHAANGADRSSSVAERNAHALVAIAAFFNNNNTKAGSRRNRAHVAVSVTEGPDGEPQGHMIGSGKPVPRSKLAQWFCDSTISRMMQERGRVLDYGVEVRDIPDHLWQAVAARDRGCRLEGCDCAPGRCEVHHVIPADARGPTAIDNLVMTCPFHHHQLHKPGWTARMDPDGTLHVTAPDGTVTTTVPPLLRDTLGFPGDDPQ